MKSNAQGVIGVVYKNQTGLERHDPQAPPPFGISGWEQINVTTRRLVVRKRSNAKRTIWIARKNEEDYIPKNHRDDGALF